MLFNGGVRRTLQWATAVAKIFGYYAIPQITDSGRLRFTCLLLAEALHTLSCSHVE
jgi:hypothetical protein